MTMICRRASPFQTSSKTPFRELDRISERMDSYARSGAGQYVSVRADGADAGMSL